MDKILLVEIQDKPDEEKRRYIIDVPKGVVYSDKKGFESRFPVRWVSNKMSFWDDEKREWVVY